MTGGAVITRIGRGYSVADTSETLAGPAGERAQKKNRQVVGDSLQV